MNTTQTNILRFIFLLSVAIEFTYELGYSFGKFYRANLHTHTKETCAFIINRFIDFALLAGEGARVIYTNRNDILAEANAIRNNIGRAFSYEYTV